MFPFYRENAMITGKKLIIASLCLILSVCTLASCAESSENNALLQLEALAKNTSEKYVIVVPTSCGEELVNSAKIFSDKISEQTGIGCNVLFDSGENISRNSCFLILLGNTSYSESKNALVGLRCDDYICRAYENMLVLGGISDKATVNAVEKYISEVLPMCEPTSIVADDCDFEYHQNYAISEMVLCGFELDCYTFVCSDDKGSASYKLVGMLREIIADKSGYYPDIEYSATPTDGRREIIAEKCDRSQLARVYFDGEDVFISSDTVYGLSVAATELCNRLFNGAEQGKTRVDIPYEITRPYSCAELSVTTAISKYKYNSNNTAKAEALLQKLSAAESAVTAVGPLDRDTWGYVKFGFHEGFYNNCVELSDDTILPIFVDTTVFSVENQRSGLHDGLVEINLLLTHKDSGELINFYFFFAESGGEYTSVVTECFSEPDEMTVAVFMSYGSSKLNVSGAGISTEYNSSVTVEHRKYHCALFSSSQLLHEASEEDKCENVSEGYFNGAEFQKLFCNEFLVLAK